MVTTIDGSAVNKYVPYGPDIETSDQYENGGFVNKTFQVPSQ